MNISFFDNEGDDSDDGGPTRPKSGPVKGGGYSVPPDTGYSGMELQKDQLRSEYAQIAFDAGVPSLSVDAVDAMHNELERQITLLVRCGTPLARSMEVLSNMSSELVSPLSSVLWSSDQASVVNGSALPRAPAQGMGPSLLCFLASVGLPQVFHSLLFRFKDWSTKPFESLVADLVLPAEEKARLLFEIHRLREYCLTDSPAVIARQSSFVSSAKGASSSSSSSSSGSAASAAAAAGKVGDCGTLPRSDAVASAVLTEKLAEDHLRALFVQNPAHAELKNAHVHLQNLYAQPRGADAKKSTPLDQQKVTKLECKSLPVLFPRSPEPFIGNPVIVTEDQFMVNWLSVTDGIFDGLDWSNLFVAGGSVLGCLLPNFMGETETGVPVPGANGFQSSDIDLFICGLSPAEATKKLQTVLTHIAKKMPDCKADILVSPYSVTLLGLYPHRHIQIVLRCYQSPAQVLIGFDIDCVCVGFDGSKVWALPRAMRALRHRTNIADLSRRSLTYEQRLLKYTSRGFGVAVPNLPYDEVAWERLPQSSLYSKGLLKLLIDHHQHDTQYRWWAGRRAEGMKSHAIAVNSKARNLRTVAASAKNQGEADYPLAEKPEDKKDKPAAGGAASSSSAASDKGDGKGSSSSSAAEVKATPPPPVSAKDAEEVEPELKRLPVLFGDYGWVPSYGCCTRQSLDRLYAENHVIFRMRDGSSVRLCKIDQLVMIGNGDRDADIAKASKPAAKASGSKGDSKHGSKDDDDEDDVKMGDAEGQVPAGKVGIAWLTKNQGRQLLTGSFHPLDDDQWESRAAWHKLELSSGRTIESLFYLLSAKQSQGAGRSLNLFLQENGVLLNAGICGLICGYMTLPEVLVLNALQWKSSNPSFLAVKSSSSSSSSSSGRQSMDIDSEHKAAKIPLERTWDAFLPPSFTGASPAVNTFTGEYALHEPSSADSVIYMPLKPLFSNAVANVRPLTRSAAALLRSLLAHFLEQEIAASGALADLPTTEGKIRVMINDQLRTSLETTTDGDILAEEGGGRALQKLAKAREESMKKWRDNPASKSKKGRGHYWRGVYEPFHHKIETYDAAGIALSPHITKAMMKAALLPAGLSVRRRVGFSVPAFMSGVCQALVQRLVSAANQACIDDRDKSSLIRPRHLARAIAADNALRHLLEFAWFPSLQRMPGAPAGKKGKDKDDAKDESGDAAMPDNSASSSSSSSSSSSGTVGVKRKADDADSDDGEPSAKRARSDAAKPAAAAASLAPPAAAPAPASPSKPKRVRCRYGKDCYRKNPDHKREFSHPSDADWNDPAPDPKLAPKPAPAPVPVAAPFSLGTLGFFSSPAGSIWNPAKAGPRRNTAFPDVRALLPAGAQSKPYEKLSVSSANVFDQLWRDAQTEAKKKPIAEKAVPALEAAVDRLLERIVPDVLRFARVAATPAVGLAGSPSPAAKPPSDKDRTFAVRAGHVASAVRLHKFLGKRRALLGFGQGHAVRLFTGSGEIEGLLREKESSGSATASSGAGGVFDEPVATSGSAAIASAAAPGLAASPVKPTSKTVVIAPMTPKLLLPREWMQKRLTRVLEHFEGAWTLDNIAHDALQCVVESYLHELLAATARVVDHCQAESLVPDCLEATLFICGDLASTDLVARLKLPAAKPKRTTSIDGNGVGIFAEAVYEAHLVNAADRKPVTTKPFTNRIFVPRRFGLFYLHRANAHSTKPVYGGNDVEYDEAGERWNLPIAQASYDKHTGNFTRQKVPLFAHRWRDEDDYHRGTQKLIVPEWFDKKTLDATQVKRYEDALAKPAERLDFLLHRDVTTDLGDSWRWYRSKRLRTTLGHAVLAELAQLKRAYEGFNDRLRLPPVPFKRTLRKLQREERLAASTSGRHPWHFGAGLTQQYTPIAAQLIVETSLRTSLRHGALLAALCSRAFVTSADFNLAIALRTFE